MDWETISSRWLQSLSLRSHSGRRSRTRRPMWVLSEIKIYLDSKLRDVRLSELLCVLKRFSPQPNDTMFQLDSIFGVSPDKDLQRSSGWPLNMHHLSARMKTQIPNNILFGLDHKELLRSSQIKRFPENVQLPRFSADTLTRFQSWVFFFT